MPRKMTVAEIAKRDHISRQAVEKKVRRRNIRRDASGRVDVALFDRRTPETEPATISSARRRYWAAKADLAAMEAQERKGKLITTESVERVLVNMAIAIKTDMLAIPNALAPELVGLSTPEIAVKLRTAIVDALRHLAENKP